MRDSDGCSVWRCGYCVTTCVAQRGVVLTAARGRERAWGSETELQGETAMPSEKVCGTERAVWCSRETTTVCRQPSPAGRQKQIAASGGRLTSGWCHSWYVGQLGTDSSKPWLVTLVVGLVWHSLSSSRSHWTARNQYQYLMHGWCTLYSTFGANGTTSVGIVSPKKVGRLPV